MISLNTKDLTEAEFDVLWQMYCDFRYCSITPDELKAYEVFGKLLEDEGKARGLLDDW